MLSLAAGLFHEVLPTPAPRWKIGIAKCEGTAGSCLLREGQMLFLPACWFHEVPRVVAALPFASSILGVGIKNSGFMYVF